MAYAIGVLSYELKDYEEAGTLALRDALALGYREPDFACFTLGQMAEERKLSQEAVNWYEAITSGPQLPQAQKPAGGAGSRRRQADAAARLERLADMQNTCARRAGWRKRNWRAMPSNPTAPWPSQRRPWPRMAMSLNGATSAPRCWTTANGGRGRARPARLPSSNPRARKG